MYLILQEPKNKATTEEELVREVERLKAKVEAGRACYIEKYKECQRLHKQIRQLRASTMVGGRVRGPVEVRDMKVRVFRPSPEDVYHYILLVKRGGVMRPEANLNMGKAPWELRPSPPMDPRDKGFVMIEAARCRLSPFLFLPFEEAKQDQKSQQEPVGMGSDQPDTSTVIG